MPARARAQREDRYGDGACDSDYTGRGRWRGGHPATVREASARPPRQVSQLQTWQRPSAQEHTGGRAPARRGPHRRTQSTASGSLRSPGPPGQQCSSIVETSRSVSDSARSVIDSMCASIRGSRAWPAIRYRDTRHGGGSGKRPTTSARTSTFAVPVRTVGRTQRHDRLGRVRVTREAADDDRCPHSQHVCAGEQRASPGR